MHPAYFQTCFSSRHGTEDWPERFVIITACATTGESWTDAMNEAENRKLEAVLQGRGQWMRAVTGHSLETKYLEPGWAVELDWEQGCDLEDQFQQDAIYVVDGDALSVTYCDGRRTRVAALFPNEASLLRLISALLCGQSDEWLTSKIHLKMNPGHPPGA
mgnify:FL=1